MINTYAPDRGATNLLALKPPSKRRAGDAWTGFTVEDDQTAMSRAHRGLVLHARAITSHRASAQSRRIVYLTLWRRFELHQEAYPP